MMLKFWFLQSLRFGPRDEGGVGWGFRVFWDVGFWASGFKGFVVLELEVYRYCLGPQT